ncbi:syncytin-1-like [Hylobates moloch]|uniref:syncytin-1-like n=1 Tax=Hylobates moloch TaxID=81572 RepID=UPI002677540A|nr:syncytin-1-like [Hylobates moloch]
MQFMDRRIEVIKLQMVLRMEPQMSSTNNFYRGPLNQPTDPLAGLESSPLEDTNTAGPLLRPYPAVRVLKTPEQYYYIPRLLECQEHILGEGH